MFNSYIKLPEGIQAPHPRPPIPKEMLPRPVVALSHVCVAQVSCGHSHCCAVTDSGDVWAWGSSRTFGHTEQSAYPNVPTMIKADSAAAGSRCLIETFIETGCWNPVKY